MAIIATSAVEIQKDVCVEENDEQDIRESSTELPSGRQGRE